MKIPKDAKQYKVLKVLSKIGYIQIKSNKHKRVRNDYTVYPSGNKTIPIPCNKQGEVNSKTLRRIIGMIGITRQDFLMLYNGI